MLDQELDTYWKTVVNTIHDGIMILNTQGIIVSVNRALEAITGYNRAELIGQPCTIFDCNICKKALLDSGRHWCTLFKTHNINQRKCLIKTKAMDILMRYTWPGNVRELRSAFEYAFVTCQESMIQPFHFPSTIFNVRKQHLAKKLPACNMQATEKKELIDALEKSGGNKTKAAGFLGVSRVTVWNRMKRFGIVTPRQTKMHA